MWKLHKEERDTRSVAEYFVPWNSSQPVESLQVVILIKVSHILLQETGVEARVVILINSCKVIPATTVSNNDPCYPLPPTHSLQGKMLEAVTESFSKSIFLFSKVRLCRQPVSDLLNLPPVMVVTPPGPPPRKMLPLVLSICRATKLVYSWLFTASIGCTSTTHR